MERLCDLPSRSHEGFSRLSSFRFVETFCCICLLFDYRQQLPFTAWPHVKWNMRCREGRMKVFHIVFHTLLY